MQVILVEKVEKLGDVGELVTVKNGFARNFLIPQKKALRCTEENKVLFESKKQEFLEKNKQLKTEAEVIYKKIHNKAVSVIRQASDEGRLFGSVMPKDIAERVSETFALDIAKSKIVLAKAIKETGLFEAKVRVHADFVATIKVNVARSEQEAKTNLAPTKVKEDTQDTEESA